MNSFEPLSCAIHLLYRGPAIRTAIQLFPVESWPQLHEVARLRIENKFIKSAHEGNYTIKCKGGAFATWCESLLPHFALKREMANTLAAKLFSSNRNEQDYVFQYFFDKFPDLVAAPSSNFMNQMKKALKDGDKRFYDAISPPWGGLDDYWRPLEKEYKEFKEQPYVDEGPPESDDVPF